MEALGYFLLGILTAMLLSLNSQQACNARCYRAAPQRPTATVACYALN
jgi:hypothetical protein